MAEHQSVSFPNPFPWAGKWINYLVLSGAGVVGGSTRNFMTTTIQSLLSDEFAAKCLQALVFACIGAVVTVGRDLILDRLRRRRDKKNGGLDE